MVIEHAERFGLSHCIIARRIDAVHRNRIASRRSLSSYDDARARWKPWFEPQTFQIAETDLQLPAPANFSALASPAKWVSRRQPAARSRILETRATKPSH